MKKIFFILFAFSINAAFAQVNDNQVNPQSARTTTQVQTGTAVQSVGRDTATVQTRQPGKGNRPSVRNGNSQSRTSTARAPRRSNGSLDASGRSTNNSGGSQTGTGTSASGTARSPR